ncbi:MAG: hypothetical protein A2904_02405 [Candidatus Staskawiczbacteria bacterium RIFCSPLOWO2_01_FULL_33_9]|uniref:Uncharacterized protein n=1 Tax=Candidatus Staskawiczbacteria bacterium RIFCSPLOWO2_01_FULL_33_9 TaxID=1802211 RepID=A0A1G2I634_9BACT|nr:MAG: hypothetical protein A2904_02405 [Candidatus Staskawiczbacteria bacterium RIFCSPLOWO2_01_FULL_33_9]
MNERGFVKNIVIIIMLLIVVFLSQQPYFNEVGKKLYSQGEVQVKMYWEGIYPRVSGEVEQKGAIIQQEINKQKDNISQNIWQNIKNYFGNIFSKVSGTPVQ